MNRVLIVGAGGHGQVVADILHVAAHSLANAPTPVGFLDDNPALHGAHFLGLPVLGATGNWRDIGCDALVVAVGDNAARRRLFLDLRAQGACFVNAVHPTATLAADVCLGEGIAVSAGVIVCMGSTIGDGAILNTGCTVDHHSYVSAFAHLAPGVHIGGNVTIGSGALVGIGTAVVPGCTIGKEAVIGAGAAVIRDVPASVLSVGVPARVIRQVNVRLSGSL